MIIMMNDGTEPKTPVHPKSIFTDEQVFFLFRVSTGEVQRYYPLLKDRERLMSQCCRQVQRALSDIDQFVECFQDHSWSYQTGAVSHDAQLTIKKHRPVIDKALRWADVVEGDALEKQTFRGKRK